MSIKKTGSPLSSGAEGLEPLGGNEDPRGKEKIEKSFETALAELTGEINQTDASDKTDSPTRNAFQQIAANANLDSQEGAMSAVRQSAHFIVESRLKEGFRDSEHGKKISEDLSNYISKDPFLQKKLLGILQRLK
jgi:hypothetical protein